MIVLSVPLPILLDNQLIQESGAADLCRNMPGVQGMCRPRTITWLARELQRAAGTWCAMKPPVETVSSAPPGQAVNSGN
ncbi:hypothetical protein RRG08_033195 [Elysia crispata]|uniref:Uncharacterized protein n=1 Tax=Elysia crispata TaxID=231223 RepID=A0AAE1BBY3_9GAST|nr:hypothetical protein RRG08_033195 [Elysia crispata]